MKNYFLVPLLNLILSNACAMDNPAETNKQINPVPMEISDVRSAFEKLPDELKNHILSFLTTARGKTPEARLQAAAENIRTFMTLNKAFAPFLDDQKITNYLITELANRYTRGNLVEAALALQTPAAGAFLIAYFTNLSQKEIIYDSFEHAASQGQDALLRFMLKYIPDLPLNSRGALTQAANNGYESTVKLLLERGSNADRTNLAGNTPLYFAANKGHLAIVNLLIAAGADVNKPSSLGRTALMSAALKGHVDVMQALLATHANPNKQDSEGLTALNHALANKQEAAANALLKAGANVNLADNDGRTPLMRAIQVGLVSTVKKLLEAGAHINATTAEGDTAFTIAQGQFIPNREAIMQILDKHMAEHP